MGCKNAESYGYGTVNFEDGQKRATISVPTIDNEEKSGNVKFYCNIDTPSG